jgi:uncharacterized membrane protein YeaQ/YmgE (transglycosylase-associated protein family)
MRGRHCADRTLSTACQSARAHGEHHLSLSRVRRQRENGSMDAAVGGATGGVIGLLLVAVIGLVIGVVAKLLMPGPDPGGWFVTILLGIAGSWVGSLLISLTGLAGTVPSLVAAVVGAMLLLGAYRLLKKQS